MASTGGSGSSSSQLTRFVTGGSGGSKAINWRLLLLTCLLSLATVTGILFFNPGGIVPRGLLLPSPPKKKKGGKGKEEEGGEEGSAVQQGEVPVEKGEDEVEYETLGAKAVEAFKQGDYARALEGFSAALKLGESMRNVAAQQRTLLSNRAAAHEKLGQLNLALTDCAQILRTEPKNFKAQKRRERIRDMLLARGEYQAALTELMVTFLLDMESYKRTLLLNPTAAAEQQLLPPPNLDEVAKSAARMMVEELEANGERTVAKVLPATYTIKQVLQILPSYQALRARASSLRPVEEVSQELEGAASDDAPRRLTLLFERALTHVAESRFQRADQDLQAALGMALDTTEESSLEGEEQAALFSWGGTFLHLKHELEKAKEVLERACDLSPTDPEIWVKRACLHLDRNETDEAKTHFDHATSLAPDAAFVYLWRCQLWMCGKVNEESLQKAEAELNKCLELDEGNAVALCRLMQCKMQGNDAEAAEAAIERAKRAAPRNADVVGAHAEFLLTQGKVDEAGRELEKAIRLDPSNPLPFINKALIAWQAQDSATARETLRHVIEMDPQYQPAYHFLANLEFKGANSYEESEPAFATIDKGISICRSKEDLEEMCQIKALAIAKLDAAARLGLRAGDLMG